MYEILEQSKNCLVKMSMLMKCNQLKASFCYQDLQRGRFIVILEEVLTTSVYHTILSITSTVMLQEEVRLVELSMRLTVEYSLIRPMIRMFHVRDVCP